MESVAGLTVLAFVVLALGYLVPHRVRQKQQWAQSRAEDRFSGALRVLATAGPGDGDAGRQLHRDDAITPVPVLREIASRPSRPALEPGSAAVERTRARSQEGTQAVEKIRTEPVAPARDDRVPAGRLHLLERRAAAARRRLVLTVLLLAATAGAAVVVAMTPVPWWVAVVPAVLLLLVLVLGRRAARAARRSDAAWLAQHRAQAGRAPARQLRVASPSGGPVPARVTGRAVHGSQAHTQMIPRVTPQDLDRARAAARESGLRGTTVVDDADAEGNATVRDAVAPVGTGADGAARTVEGVTSAAEPAEPVGEPTVAADADAERGPAPWETRPPSGRAWDPVPVPPPTYTMKATVGRPEPEPPVPAPPVPADPAGVEVSPATTGPTPVAGPVPTRPVGDEPKPTTATLGLDLNEILARRRAAGQ